MKKNNPGCNCCGGDGCCCTPWLWDWSIDVDAADDPGAGVFGCDILDGTYSHGAETFTEVGECNWSSQFDTGLTYSGYAVYSQLDLLVDNSGGGCSLYVNYALYYDAGGGASYLIRRIGYLISPCDKPSGAGTFNEISALCNSTSSISFTAV